MAIFNELLRGRLELNDELQTWLPMLDGSPVGALTVSQAFGHAHGLHTVNGVAARMAPVEMLDRAILEIRTRPDLPARNSDYAAGHLLGRLLEAVVGRDYRQHLATCQPDDEPTGALSTFVDCRTGRGFTALGDIIHRNVEKWNPAFGWYSSASRLAERALRAWSSSGRPPVVSRSLAAKVLGSSSWDEELERPLDLGVLGHHHYLGSAFSGLAGQGGISFCGIDPTTGVSVAFIVSPALPTHEALGRSARLTRALEHLAGELDATQ